MFIAIVPQAVEPYCVRLELAGTYVQLFVAQSLEDVFKSIFMLLKHLCEYIDVIEVYPHLDADSFSEYKCHKSLPG